MVEPGPLPGSCSKHLPANRIVNDADNQFALDHQADGNAIERAVMNIIGRAVERIDNPGWWGIGPGSNRIGIINQPARLACFFLAQERMVGKALEEKIADGLLRCQVGLGHEIKSSFFTDAEAVPPFLQDGRPEPRAFLSGVQPFGENADGHLYLSQSRMPRLPKSWKTSEVYQLQKSILI